MRLVSTNHITDWESRVQQNDRTIKALALLREFTGEGLDFNLLGGNQNRQRRRQLHNALHGKKQSQVKLSNLKHDFHRAVGVTHTCFIDEAFVGLVNELIK